MTYLLLMQQKFSPGAGSCHPPRKVYYGDILYLSIDMTHFVYKGKIYEIWFKGMEESRGIYQGMALHARKGPYNVDFRKFIYDINIPQKLYLTMVQINDVNRYLHNKYEFTYADFAGMRFEMIMPGERNI